MTITSERVEEMRGACETTMESVGGYGVEVPPRELLALLDAHAERDALVEGVRELIEEWRRAADVAEQEWRQVERDHPTGIGPLPCDVATNARMMCDSFTALLARVEGENT